MLDRLTQSLDFQAEALQLRSERQRLIASNIANADTPGYQAKDFDFAQALRQATGVLNSYLPTTTVTLHTSHAGHVAGNGLQTASGQAVGLRYALPQQTNLDSNTVDMDRERANFVDNTVRYEATLRFINSQVRTALTAITGQ